ncbi:uncharacterized protein LOC113361450 isoform X2 [Papaver somniferum]|uniref:uncharacterized protein LOC113361450 isoform X2 n=1 Tax=Papaver somniferum TaxID=3469 RepID=UPI000E704AC7|nr:uncharacterized protein LOC113361450 isoform X2 [Papaver somniferum]
MATTKNNRALMKNNNCALMKMTMTNNKSLMKSTTFGSTTVVAGASTPSVAVSNIQVEEKVHFSHPQHPLVKVNLPYIFTCMGCKEFGAGKRFSCQKCDFELHEFCALAPHSILKHPLHSQHQLVFHTKAANLTIQTRKLVRIQNGVLSQKNSVDS